MDRRWNAVGGPGHDEACPSMVFFGLEGGEVFVRVCRAAMDMDSDRD